jgi:hypothetical protein
MAKGRYNYLGRMEDFRVDVNNRSVKVSFTSIQSPEQIVAVDRLVMFLIAILADVEAHPVIANAAMAKIIGEGIHRIQESQRREVFDDAVAFLSKAAGMTDK